MKRPAVYILTNRVNGTLYIGVTSDLIKRTWQHRNGIASGFAAKYGCKLLVWYEMHETMIGAITREKQIKAGSRMEPDGLQRVKIKLADGKERTIQHIGTTSFWGPDGRPISAKQFMESLFGQLPELFRDEAELRAIWGRPDTRKALLTTLGERGFGGEQLAEMGKVIDAQKSDVFDILAYIAFALPPITRAERVEKHRGEILLRYDAKLQAFIDFVLGQYVAQGVEELDQDKLARLLELRYQTLADATAALGAAPVIRSAFVGFQEHLFSRDAPGAALQP